MAKTQKHTRKTTRRTQRTLDKTSSVQGPIYILFDLDGTLVHVDFRNTTPLPTPHGLPKTLITTNDFIDSKGQQMNYPMYLRPGVKQLLNYLLRYPKRFRVGVWTASFKNYSVGVVRKLFGDDYQQKLFCLYGTDEIKDPQTGEPMRVVVNIFTGQHLPSRTVNKKVVKDLQLVFDEYPECNPGNTLLIDDLVMHKRENPPETKKNIYSIPIWDPHVNIKDDNIWKLLSAAKRNVIIQSYSSTLGPRHYK
jgi:hypothetical protein